MSFAALCEQDYALKVMLRDVQQNRLAQAYVLIGSEAKSLQAASEFAQMLCCQNPQDGDNCGQCTPCQKIAEGRYGDFLEIGPSGKANFIKMDDVMRIQETVQFQPIEGAQRVCLVKHVDCLDSEAANAFLKTLEEPPEHTVFVLTSLSEHRVMPTILSRCKRIWAGASETDELCYAQDEEFQAVRQKLFEDLFSEGLAPALLVEQLMEQIGELKSQDDSKGHKEYVQKLLGALDSFVRDMAVLASCGLDEQLLINQDYRDLLVQLQGTLSLEQCAELHRKIAEAGQVLNYNLNAKLLLSDVLMPLEVCND